MTFLRIDSSIRRGGSITRELTRAVERHWRAERPDVTVLHCDLAALPGLGDTWQHAARSAFLPASDRTEAMRTARATAHRLADQLLAADAVAVGVPMYNFGVPAVVKSWLDLLITDSRFDPRFTPAGTALAGRPVLLLTASGGSYRPGTPRAGWDHATGYLHRILGDVFGAAVSTVAAELTAAQDDPGMRDFRASAAESRLAALRAARAAARAQVRAPAGGARSPARAAGS